MWLSFGPPRQETDRRDLVADQPRYEPGDTARILVKSPFPEAEAVLTVEREGVLSSRRVKLTCAATTLDVPIGEEHVPNVFASVVLVRGRVETKDAAAADAEGIEATPAAPRRAPSILLPRDGDEYLVEAGYPEGAQAVAIRVALPPDGGAEVRLDGAVLRLDPPGAARVVVRPGAHRLELWLRGAAAPAASARFTVRGGGA